ncbi:MAG: PD40 domain-containing protein [Nitrospirae bacterium]|nr:PD40 domain-containing protein [Nitrospirota bacterium]
MLTAAVGVLITSCALVVLPDTKYSPSLTWHTITTDHFVIHFHQGEDEIARRVAVLAEDAHRRLAPVFKWEPTTATQLILADTEDIVSGAASPIPYNTLYITLTPPAGSMFLVNYDDWLRLVITHEYAHILHLDTASGVNLALRRVFGRVPFVVFPFLTTLPNLWQPIWMIEGLATHEETDQGASDRRDNAFADMILRMAVLENDFPTIDQADGLDRWPAGQVPYLFGSRFYQYLAKEFGEHVPIEIGRQYAERPLALFVGSTGESLFGTTYRQLWDNWRRVLAQRFDAQRAGIAAGGLTATTGLTARGGMILGPAVSPDGSTIAYTENSLDAFPTLRTIRIDGAGDRAITRRNSGTHASWSPDGKTIAFAQVEIWKNYSLYSDIYLADVAGQTTRRLTHGARATDPEFSPDGTALVFVGHDLGKSRLLTLDLATGAIHPLTDWTEATQFAAPRWSPDGRSIALAVWTEGRQDIALFDVDTRSLRMITRDRATDLTPSWSRDGRTLYFTSDRTGVYNVFAYSPADGALTQATNVIGGAFTPAEIADGRLAFANYTSRGFDLHVAAPTALPASPAPASHETPRLAAVPPAVSPTAKPYSPLPTLAPRFWAPVLSADEEGGQYGATTGGLDVLGYHKYSLTALYGTSSHRGSYVFDYRFDRLYPSFDVSVSDVPTLYGDFFRDANGHTSQYWERRQRLDADMVLPIFKTRWTQALSVGYRRERLSDLSPTPFGAQPPAVGTLGGIRAVWRYDNANEFGSSISPEGGRRLVATFQRNAEAFGSDFDTARYVGAWYEYLNLPYLRHHVLALRAVGGLASGDVLPQRTFQLGGPALSEELLEDDAATMLLRGYRSRAIRGQRMAVGSLEYRFPIWNIERGFTTKPFFFHRVHGALFVDSGNAWDASPKASDYKTGVGAELGTDMTFAYRLRIRLRVGFAVGLDQDGVTQGYLSAGHAF